MRLPVYNIFVRSPARMGFGMDAIASGVIMSDKWATGAVAPDSASAAAQK